MKISFVEIEKAFDGVTKRGMERAMRKKEIPEVLVRSVMSLYEGAKTRVGVDSELSEELEVNVGMHQGSVLSTSPFAVVVDVVTEMARKVVLRWLQHADELALMSETIHGSINKSTKWKAALERKDLDITH